MACTQSTFSATINIKLTCPIKINSIKKELLEKTLTRITELLDDGYDGKLKKISQEKALRRHVIPVNVGNFVVAERLKNKLTLSLILSLLL